MGHGSISTTTTIWITFAGLPTADRIGPFEHGGARRGTRTVTKTKPEPRDAEVVHP
jgi:hypothetical protein